MENDKVMQETVKEQKPVIIFEISNVFISNLHFYVFVTSW